MDSETVPGALRQRLGPEATEGLLQVIDAAGREWKADMISLAAERFDRRLAEEASATRGQVTTSEAGVRQEIVKTEAGLRQEIARVDANLRQEITQVEASLRQEITESSGRLREEIVAGNAQLRQEIGGLEVKLVREFADTRVRLVMWMFAFWVGQTVTMTAIMSLMLRGW